MNDTIFRKNLIELLQGGQAHFSAKDVLTNLQPKLRHVRPAEELHSVWEEFEHIRIAQEDIVRYTLDASWQSPSWPEGYWPASTDHPTEERWSATLSRFFADLDEVIALVQNTDIDLTAHIPHGEGRTYLREVLLVADHNAYHLGQIVQTRKILGNWPG